MIELVTLEEVKEHLRVDGEADDGEFTRMIQGASATLLRWIQGSRSLVVDDNGKLIEGEALSQMKNAAFALIGWMDRNRSGEDEEKLQQGYLPFSVTLHIYDLRRPTVV